jgi:hypothetical protein
MEDCDDITKICNVLLEFKIKMEELREENRNIKIRNNILQKNLSYKNNIENLLKIEQNKSEFFKNLLLKNTNIVLKDLSIDKVELTEYNTENDSEEIPNKFPKNTNNKSPENKYIDNDKKKCYRTIKNCIKLEQELDRKNIINKKDEEIKKKLENLPEISSVNLDIEDLLNKIKNNRIYGKFLIQIKQKRLSLLGKLSYEDYKVFLLKYIDKIVDIFKEKKYNNKKIKNIISKNLSSIESRIIRYDNYINSHLEIDEIEILLETIKLHINFPKKFTPYDNKWLCEKMYNYSIIVYPIEKIIKYFLFNYYSFYNVIYLDLPKSSKEDPYSFYTLEKVNKDKRYWKMDCRLEELSNNMGNDILSYMINMFRKIYYDVFDDNIFRLDYSNKTQITECDCEQLLQNIFLLSQPIKFCNKIRFLVMENSCYSPTENDKFNLYGDDTLQKKKFQSTRKTNNTIDVIKELFDSITTEDAVDFYRSRNL